MEKLFTFTHTTTVKCILSQTEESLVISLCVNAKALMVRLSLLLLSPLTLQPSDAACVCTVSIFRTEKTSFEACALIADRLHVRCGPFCVCNQCDLQVINIKQGLSCCLRYRKHIGCVFSCAKVPAHVRTPSMNGDVSDANGVLLFI